MSLIPKGLSVKPSTYKARQQYWITPSSHAGEVSPGAQVGQYSDFVLRKTQREKIDQGRKFLSRCRNISQYAGRARRLLLHESLSEGFLTYDLKCQREMVSFLSLFGKIFQCVGRQYTCCCQKD